VNNLH